MYSVFFAYWIVDRNCDAQPFLFVPSPSKVCDFLVQCMSHQRYNSCNRCLWRFEKSKSKMIVFQSFIQTSLRISSQTISFAQFFGPLMSICAVWIITTAAADCDLTAWRIVLLPPPGVVAKQLAELLWNRRRTTCHSETNKKTTATKRLLRWWFQLFVSFLHGKMIQFD